MGSEILYPKSRDFLNLFPKKLQKNPVFYIWAFLGVGFFQVGSQNLEKSQTIPGWTLDLFRFSRKITKKNPSNIDQYCFFGLKLFFFAILSHGIGICIVVRWEIRHKSHLWSRVHSRSEISFSKISIQCPDTSNYNQKPDLESKNKYSNPESISFPDAENFNSKYRNTKLEIWSKIRSSLKISQQNFENIS